MTIIARTLMQGFSKQGYLLNPNAINRNTPQLTQRIEHLQKRFFSSKATQTKNAISRRWHKFAQSETGSEILGFIGTIAVISLIIQSSFRDQRVNSTVPIDSQMRQWCMEAETEEIDWKLEQIIKSAGKD